MQFASHVLLSVGEDKQDLQHIWTVLVQFHTHGQM